MSGEDLKPEHPAWLSIVPKPRARPEPATPFGPPSIQWDVFISYRSTNRTWALALYDQLVAAGFRVFLDQFVLRPGLELEVSLHEALKQSGSGVLVFSKDVEEAGWVDKERLRMKELADKRAGTSLPFNYVIARIDKSPLPFSDQDVIYADFTEGYEDGPRGAQLVRLIHGLVGVPLTESAVRVLSTMDETTKDLLLEVGTAARNEEFDEIIALMKSNRAELRDSPNIAIAAAQALISQGGPYLNRALEVIAGAQQHFPRSVRLRQMEGLALRRLKHPSDALRVLGKLYEAGHRDPETVGIYAASWYVRYKESNDRTDLERSRNLYAEAFELSPTNEYVGINAASKSAFLGELDLAREFALKVGKLVNDHADGKDLYKSFSLAEALTLVGKYDNAAIVYRTARNKHPNRADDIAGALEQVETLIQVLKVPDESAAKLRQALGVPAP